MSFSVMVNPTETASNLSDWSKLIGSAGIVGLLLAISGIIGGIVVFVVNTQIAALKTEIESLKSQLAVATTAQKKQEDVAGEAEKETEKIFAILEGLQNSELKADDAARLRRVLKGFDQLRSSYIVFEEYKTAAKWLDSQKKIWLKKGCNLTIKEQPKLLPFMGKKHFETDLSKYLAWVSNSLYYGHARTPLSKFVNKPYVKSPFAYISALKNIKNIAVSDSGTLSVKQVEYLEGMIEELLERIPNEFR